MSFLIYTDKTLNTDIFHWLMSTDLPAKKHYKVSPFVGSKKKKENIYTLLELIYNYISLR